MPNEYATYPAGELLPRGANRLYGHQPETIMAKRGLINTGNDKRYVRRDEKGRFKESDDQGKSLTSDRRQAAKKTVASGQGDRGDQKRK
jgi:hypothetical protein